MHLLFRSCTMYNYPTYFIFFTHFLHSLSSHITYLDVCNIINKNNFAHLIILAQAQTSHRMCNSDQTLKVSAENAFVGESLFLCAVCNMHTVSLTTNWHLVGVRWWRAHNQTSRQTMEIALKTNKNLKKIHETKGIISPKTKNVEFITFYMNENKHANISFARNPFVWMLYIYSKWKNVWLFSPPEICVCQVWRMIRNIDVVSFCLKFKLFIVFKSLAICLQVNAYDCNFKTLIVCPNFNTKIYTNKNVKWFYTRSTINGMRTTVLLDYGWWWLMVQRN